MSRIVILDGHPDAAPHFIHAAADAYAEGAKDGGHEVRRIAIASLDFPLIRNEAQFQAHDVPIDILEAQEALIWSEHVAIFYPLWLGSTPALFKGFLEQVLRPHFAFQGQQRGFPKGLLAGRSARVVVSMGMPAPVYELYYRAHGVKALKRNVLEFVGLGPVRYAVIGMIDGGEARRKRWLARLRGWGRSAA
ncbi:dehydrogenase [Novosphingobium sp. PC22D]|uniref:NAD(P)H-dependent oxidoreductase n=1 Tax=Novosphingobium sp. PC22D TaxID=1962403 RepID=UPI000BEF906D|nr:NAD(P)H-dependent oxidoreductase [Novosphingobium sp. PC22D]PEQ11755.1 dehydrogenase [Novosphingobium sp. PC22D]